MSLDRFRRTRMVIMAPHALAYQAARAMADNHVGSILVGEPGALMGMVTDRDLALAVLGGDVDPKSTPLREVMSEGMISCDIDADLDEVVRLMQKHGVRRVPVTQNGRLVGLITFDDLVVDGSVSLDSLRSIVTAQLEVEAPHKPAGLLHPQGSGRAELQAAGRARALMRAQARAETAYGVMTDAVSNHSAGLDLDRSKRALFLATCMLCRRLTPGEAQHLIAQLPSKLRPQLDHCIDGPDRNVTADAIKRELGTVLGLGAERADIVMRAVFRVIASTVASGQIEEVRGQLPDDMKQLLPVRQMQE